jgi:hypothetical protein
VVFDDYCATVRAAPSRVRRLETALMQQATTSPQVRMIARPADVPWHRLPLRGDHRRRGR